MFVILPGCDVEAGEVKMMDGQVACQNQVEVQSY